MKKIAAVLLVILICASMPVISFADNIYIVDDEEDIFVPETTTAKPAETTTAAQTESLFGDMDIEGYLGEFSGMLEEGIGSLVSDFEESFGDFDLGSFGKTEEEQPQEQLQPISPDETITVKPVVTTKAPASTTASVQEQVQGQTQQNDAQISQEELPSVIIVNQADNSSDTISGSTLTLLVFVAAIVIIILTGAIVLVLMTKRTEYNSSVKSRSTIPGVEQPNALAQFMDDGIKDDGKDYGNITYWNDI